MKEVQLRPVLRKQKLISSNIFFIWLYGAHCIPVQHKETVTMTTVVQWNPTLRPAS